jgi:hypothetical protein
MRPVLLTIGAGKVQRHDAEAVSSQVNDTGARIAAERGRIVRTNPFLRVARRLAGPGLYAARRQPHVVEDRRDHLRGLMSDGRHAAEQPSLRLPRKTNHVKVARSCAAVSAAACRWKVSTGSGSGAGDWDAPENDDPVLLLLDGDVATAFRRGNEWVVFNIEDPSEVRFVQSDEARGWLPYPETRSAAK